MKCQLLGTKNKDFDKPLNHCYVAAMTSNKDGSTYCVWYRKKLYHYYGASVIHLK